MEGLIEKHLTLSVSLDEIGSSRHLNVASEGFRRDLGWNIRASDDLFSGEVPAVLLMTSQEGGQLVHMIHETSGYYSIEILFVLSEICLEPFLVVRKLEEDSGPISSYTCIYSHLTRHQHCSSEWCLYDTSASI